MLYFVVDSCYGWVLWLFSGFSCYFLSQGCVGGNTGMSWFVRDDYCLMFV